MTATKAIESAYSAARDRYAEIGVDCGAVLTRLSEVPLSLHCWQGDDVLGFEKGPEAEGSGGIQVTGRFPGRARNPEELREDLESAFSLIPGPLRINLHAMYGDFGEGFVDRDAVAPEHFQSWVDWAAEQGTAIDFNPTCFAHPMADSGFTLSHKDVSVREFWLEHIRRTREIAAWIGREQQSPCIHNLWIPDGSKDITVDRWAHRRILLDSLDEIFSEAHRPEEMKDSLESKLFGIGSESFVTGSHDFYMGYAFTRGKILCLDTGHFHPTESLADKVSAVLQFSGELLLHVSRGIRWDSDHVVILDDPVRELFAEIVRSGVLDRVSIALDFFDASINRIGAWVIGARAARKALLTALLEPRARLLEAEESGDYFSRLALLEELKTLPFGAVWDYFCLLENSPVGLDMIEDVKRRGDALASRRG